MGLISDFVDAINEHREAYFKLSEYLCIDESIIKWYGAGGNWIEHGLPDYVAIDRKPENGCEIQNLCWAKSGIMLKLQIVKGNTEICNESSQLGHGTKVLQSLIRPWASQVDSFVEIRIIQVLRPLKQCIVWACST